MLFWWVQGVLAEILEFVMGKGLIPADGEIWRVRRRAIVPALHQKAITYFFVDRLNSPAGFCYCCLFVCPHWVL